MSGEAPQELQEAVVLALRADAALVALLLAPTVTETVDPDTDFPYMVIYASDELENDTSDTEGSEITFEFHIYESLNGGGGDVVRSIGKSLRRILSAKTSADFPMTNTDLSIMRFQSKRSVRDGAENVYRSIITYWALTTEK
ncbi:MAG: DUF3168 domain-containing protein [Gammaproteobacteria bacterium]|nr:DUF3168 domain-containing protein [Gammaproteobacteria bacterium]